MASDLSFLAGAPLDGGEDIDDEEDEDGLVAAGDDDVEEEDVDDDARFLEVCSDGDVDDLVALLEDMAEAGETLTANMLNYPDASGRVSEKITIEYLRGRNDMMTL